MSRIDPTNMAVEAEPLAPMQVGVVSAVRGSIVEIKFEHKPPAIHNIIYANNRAIVLEVLTQLPDNKVRTIALTPT